MKRKVIIVTFSDSNNYGSCLQAIGLGRYFEKKGFEVCYLRSFRAIRFIFAHPYMAFSRIANKLHSRQNKAFFDPSPYQIGEERQRRMASFKSDNYRYLSIMSDKEWQTIIKKDNPIIVAGSDIIWQPAIGYPAKYFLDMAYYAHLDSFSYASSFGSKRLPSKYYPAYKRYLGSFKGIGVREKAAAEMLKEIIGRDIKKVVDPTMLLTEEEWSQFSEKAKPITDLKKGEYLVCYFVMEDPRYWEYVRIIREKYDRKIVVLPMHKTDEEQPYMIMHDATPYEFVELIKNAEFICTDSFHAAVFSFLFEKELYILQRKRKDEDDKFSELVRRYNLEDRIVQDEKTFFRNAMNSFEEAKNKLVMDRQDSEQFLEKCLLECK